jgi:GxxExxY protein
MDAEAVAKIVVDAMLKVHRTFGPGLLESAYQQCLIRELILRGLKVAFEVVLPITYEGAEIESGYRIDMLVEDCVIIENKAVTELLPVHHMQILTYMRLSKVKLGFLVNWNVKLIKDGIHRKIIS